MAFGELTLVGYVPPQLLGLLLGGLVWIVLRSWRL